MVHDPTLLPPARWPADFAGDPGYRRAPAQQRQFEELLGSATVLFGIPDLDADLLARTVRSNPGLAWVQVMAAGAAAHVRQAGLVPSEVDRVAFTTGAGVHAGPLSEFALLGLLAGAKDLPRLQRDQAERRWPGRWSMRQLAEQRIVVVGLGHLGRGVAAKLHALGATVVGVNRSDRAVPGIEVTYPLDRVREAIAGANAVVNTLPEMAGTRHLLSSRVLAALAPGATVVSIGRGSVIDEAALIEALVAGQVGFAALDVFEVEPLAASSPLWDMPQVLISPHTAANSPHEERLLVDLFCSNLERFVAGEPLLNRVEAAALA